MQNQLESAEKVKTTAANDAFKFLTKKDLKSLTPIEFKKHESKVQEKYTELGQISSNTEVLRFLNAKEEKILARLHKYVENFDIEPQNMVKKDETENKSIEKNTNKEEVSNKQNNQNLEVDKSKNIDYLTNQIKFLGFGERPSLIKDLATKMEKGTDSFTINLDYDKVSFQNKASFELTFNRSEKSGNYFLNNFLAKLSNEKRNTDISHTFAVKQNGFTAKQAVNLLEGRSVLTNITNKKGSPEEAFLNLKLQEPKLETGNFKIQVFNKNYGVDTAKIVANSPLAFDTDLHKDVTLKSLNKGNIVNVKIENEGKTTQGFAVLNPQYKSLNLYDQNMQRINNNKAAVNESLDLEASNKNTIKQSR